jgi:peptidoglycan/LPS O-acetylase OafA/YrhL
MITAPIKLPDRPAIFKPEAAHIPQLDGIRGLAILLVMLCHGSAILRDFNVSRYLEYGWVGVDLFFVLSGFLITQILLTSSGQPRYYQRFYIRRGLRIWPLYYFFIAAGAIGLALLPASEHAPHMVTPWPYYLFFVQNLYPLSLFCSLDFLAVTWSLCIEEHFYLIWPVLVKHCSLRRLKTGLIVLLVLEPLLRVLVCAALRHSPYDFFYQAVTRLGPLHFDSIAAGSLVALVWRELRDPQRYLRRFAVLSLGGLVATVLLIPFQSTNGYVFSFCFSASALLFAGVLSLGLLGWQKRLFTLPALRYTGKISYGLYLIHPMIFWTLQSHNMYAKVGLGRYPYFAEALGVVLAFGLSFLIAAISWRFYESPILGLKRRLAP